MKNATLFALINAKGGGGGGGSVSAPEKDVNFIDYDGRIVYSYTATDFANLSAMPENPTHTGLTAQGWNWSLSDAKTYVATYGQLWIGQMYITDDGKTRLYIHIADVARNVVPLYWNQSVSEGVTINWGDGSAEETFSGTGNKNTTHTYTSAGNYVITLDVTSGTAKLGYGSSEYAVLGNATSIRCYLNMLKKAEIGSNMSLYAYAFTFCYSLSSITIPNNIISIGNNAFNNCFSLLSITIPSNITSILYYTFYGCYSLSNIAIPNSVTSINMLAFNQCYSLSSITIPSSVTYVENSTFAYCSSLEKIHIPSVLTSIPVSIFEYCYSIVKISIPSGVKNIYSYAFSACTSMKEYHLLPTTPPTLSSINVFNSIPSDCIIYVPYSADHSILATYKSTSNWSTYADYMEEEPQ